MRGLLPVLLAALLVAGCLSSPKTPVVAPVGQATDLPLAQRPVTSAAFASYLHDLSQPIAGVDFAHALIEQHRTKVSDMVELDTWIARPKIDAKVPVVLDVTPYYGGGPPATLGRVGTELIQRGYAVGVSSVRGTGQSGGCFTQGSPQEAKDTAAVVEDLAAQPWSNGNVGIMGVSYDGTTPQETWVEAPPHLKTIVPIAGISDMYKYNFVNGVHIEPQGYAFNTYYWAEEGPTQASFADHDPNHSVMAIAGEACPDQVDVQQGGLTSGLDGNKDDYWQQRDFLARLQASPEKNPQRASVWYIHGLQDWNVKDHNLQDWLPAIEATGVPYKVWLGQWPHAWPAPTGVDVQCKFDDNGDKHGDACRADWWNEGMVAWFDQFLKGIDTGVLDGPRVQIQNDDGRWHLEQSWPPMDAAHHVFRPTVDGRLDAVGGKGSLSYNDGLGSPLYSVDKPNTVDLASTNFQLTWRSEPVADEWDLSGSPVFHANVTSSGARANLLLSLGEQLPDGSLRSFNFCAQSLNHVADPANGNPDIAGMRQELTLRCFPQDDILHAGSRLVLIAAGNTVTGPNDDGPGFQPLSYDSTITIDMEGAWLDLPVDHSLVFEDPQPYVDQSS